MKQFVKTQMAMARDLGYLVDLEIKCQHYPRDLENLKKFVNEEERVAFLALIGQRVVGYTLCLKQTITVKEEMFDTLLCSVGVHPDFRNLGVSKKLMNCVSQRAIAEKCHSILMMVPSYVIDDPHDPDYIGWWFEALEFKAVRCLDREYYHYGKSWDGYIFEALV